MTKESRSTWSILGGLAVTFGVYLWLGTDYFPGWAYLVIWPAAIGALYNGMTEAQAYEKLADRED